jgi:hypothetical protein
MAYRYQIQSPATETALMGADQIGGMISILFFDAGGLPVVPVGIPTIQRSAYATGSIWQTIQPFSNGEWRFNGYSQRVRVSMAGVTGFASYLVEVWRSPEPVPMIPDGAYTGLRASIVQGYDESNKKLGSQWEASRLVTIASSSPANNAYSIILTGSKPVDLKSRVFGYDELGIIGRIYKNPVYTGGTIDPWYNMRPSLIGSQPEARLLIGFTLTIPGVKCGADVVGIGPNSAQSRGATPQQFGSNRILDEPNTAYLLEIASRNTGSQIVWARVEIYEGDLDLPITV